MRTSPTYGDRLRSEGRPTSTPSSSGPRSRSGVAASVFAAGADAAAGVAFAAAVDAERLRLPSAFGFLSFPVPIAVAVAEGPRALRLVETIATRPALSSRVAVANVQANAEDIVETPDVPSARVAVNSPRRTRHPMNT